LNRLWEQLPSEDRRSIAQIVAQIVARQILPSAPKEGSDET
jgi:hypothetical protein